MNPADITPGAILSDRRAERFRRILRIDGELATWDEVRRSRMRPGLRTAVLRQSSPVSALSRWGTRLATAEERAAVLDELEAL